jgi:hypothetical protein
VVEGGCRCRRGPGSDAGGNDLSVGPAAPGRDPPPPGAARTDMSFFDVVMDSLGGDFVYPLFAGKESGR